MCSELCMTVENMNFKERRKQKRFQVEEGAVSIVVYSTPVIIGQIIDISPKGIAFSYVSDGEKVNGAFNVDIFAGENGYYCRRIPFHTVSDKYLDNEVPFSSIIIRRCSGKFGDLTRDQVSQMDVLIRKNNLGKNTNSGVLSGR